MLANEDIRPISYLKTHTAETIFQVNDTQRPIYITQNGTPKAVVVDSLSYEKITKALDLLRIIAQGQKDIEMKRYTDHDKFVKAFRKKNYSKKHV